MCTYTTRWPHPHALTTPSSYINALVQLAVVLQPQLVAHHQANVVAWEGEVGQALLVEGHVPPHHDALARLRVSMRVNMRAQ